MKETVDKQTKVRSDDVDAVFQVGHWNNPSERFAESNQNCHTSHYTHTHTPYMLLLTFLVAAKETV